MSIDEWEYIEPGLDIPTKNALGMPVSPAEAATIIPRPPMFNQSPRNYLATAMPYIRPSLEGGGMALGSILATPGTFGLGSVAGGVLGYGLGKKASDWLDTYAQNKPEPGLGESLIESAKDLNTGLKMQAGGLVGGKVLQKGMELGGKVVRPLLGRMSGLGTKSIEEALKGWEGGYYRGLRGEISKDDLLNNYNFALQQLKNKRQSDYISKLAEIANKQKDPVTGAVRELDMSPLQKELRDLMKSYRVNVLPDGTIDTTTMAIGNKGRKDAVEMIETVWTWPDKSPLGIDALKRYLQDFYSESGQARGLATALYKKTNEILTSSIPEYSAMTKPYAEATKLIKDIEAGLMMRKQGMTGRIVADQTLRRLTSSMKDNFALRGELVDILGQKAGEDLSAQLAGVSMRSVLPHGLAGTGPSLVGEAALAKFVHPGFWGVLAASSPRVQGEFLRVFGKGLKETQGMSLPVGQITSYLVQRQKEAKKNPDLFEPNAAETAPLQKESSGFVEPGRYRIDGKEYDIKSEDELMRILNQ